MELPEAVGAVAVCVGIAAAIGYAKWMRSHDRTKLMKEDIQRLDRRITEMAGDRDQDAERCGALSNRIEPRLQEEGL